MRGLRVRAALTALAGLLLCAPAAEAQAPDTTPPVVNVATLSPTPPSGNNNWFRGPVTLNLSATDNVGVAKFQYSLNNGASYVDVDLPAPVAQASASVQVTQEGNTSVRYRAVDAAGNIASFRTIAVRIDTRAPTASWPGLVDGHVGHTATLIPARTDPAPGSGGVAVLDMHIDGREVYPLPITTSDLALGAHEVTLHLGDSAGNGSLVRQTFIVTTSFADLDALITHFVGAGSVSEEAGAALHAKLAEAAAATGSKAVVALNQFVALASSEVEGASAQDTLVADARQLADEAKGTAAEEPATGFTVEPADGATVIPDPVLSPLPHNPNADYDVLVFSKTTGFRHDHIPHTILAIQKLGIEHGFNVDVYDPQLPSVSLPTSPFLSLDELKKYETIVFESTVGHNPGPLDTAGEQPNFEAYMRAGGGYVGIHGAADSSRPWAWYGNLVGGWFTNHPGGQSGFGACGSCIHTEVVTEDGSHPATAHLPKTWMTVDELYNFDRPPRADVHTLLSLNEATYQRSLNSGNAATNPLVLMGGDHPIAWCQNWAGGKAFSNILGHARWQYYDPSFMQIILGGIETTADRKDANCSTFRETALLIAATGDESVAALLDSAKASYLAKDYAAAIPKLNQLAAGTDDPKLADQARQLREWMQELERSG